MADSPAAERLLDESGVRELLAREAPDHATLPLEPVAQGWDNAIWRLGSDRAVRLPRRAVAADLIVSERRALRILAPRLATVGIETPRHLVDGTPGDTFPWPWAVVPWIEGDDALAHSRADLASVAEPLAEALLVLHQDAPSDVAANPFRGVPLHERDHAMRERLAEHPDHEVALQAWEAGLAVPDAAERVWIHGDLHPGNIVVRDRRLVGLIDFGDATAGDPAYDLACSWLLFDAAGRAAFRAATGDRHDSATWVRARAWAGYLSLTFLTRSDDRPDLRRLGTTISSALAEDG